MRIRLGVLDHHRLGNGCPSSVLRTALQHFTDERGGDGIAIEGDVDVAIDRLDRGEKGIAGGYLLRARSICGRFRSKEPGGWRPRSPGHRRPRSPAPRFLRTEAAADRPGAEQ